MLIWLPILCFGFSALLIANSAFLGSPVHGAITLFGAVLIYFAFAMTASYIICHEALISQHREAVKLLEASKTGVRPTATARMAASSSGDDADVRALTQAARASSPSLLDS